MDVQAHIPAALCALHNFIQQLDPDTFFTPEFQAECLERNEEEDGDLAAYGIIAEGAVGATEQPRAKQRRDCIAEAMWKDYCHESREYEAVHM